jgi:hypothetical protein
MKVFIFVVILIHVAALALLLSGCSSNPGSMSGTSMARSYNGSASVGDFLTITLDPATQTLLYTNFSNGDSGTVPYTANVDGTLTLNDPRGNLVSAYEVPNYALLIQAAKTGAYHDAPALITAVEKGGISVSTWAGRGFNYMQFRTAAGGVEVGSAAVDAQGNVTASSYWPYGAQSGGNAFHLGSFDVSAFQADPSGTFLKLADNDGSYDYVFGTPNGVFAVDTPNGAILGLKQAASKDFSPAAAGTYKAIYYEKLGATTDSNNMEAGAPSLGTATLVITAVGQVTVQDAHGSVILQATLTPVADAAYLYSAGSELQDPCYGLFTFRVTTPTSQQDVFLTFMDRSVLFSSFRANLPWGSGNSYDYLYGVGLK